MTDAELETLSGILHRFGGKNAMNVEQLDGFLAAVTCCPFSISWDEYLPDIWGDETILEDSFRAQPVRKEFLSLVARHKASIANTLESGEVFTPVLLPDEDGVYRGNDWAGGFVRGMNFRKPEWTALFDDEDHGGSLVPILALAHEHDPDPEMRPYQGPVSAERRDDLIIGIAAGVMRIYKYFRRPVRRERSLVADASTYRRTLPKIGRNGMITLH